MRLMYKDAVALDGACDLVEVVSLSEINNMERFLSEAGFDEIPDLPGILCLTSTVARNVDNKFMYDAVYIICKDRSVTKRFLSNLCKDGYLDISDQTDVCKCIFNPEAQEMYDLLKASADLWLSN